MLLCLILVVAAWPLTTSVAADASRSSAESPLPDQLARSGTGGCATRNSPYAKGQRVRVSIPSAEGKQREVIVYVPTSYQNETMRRPEQATSLSSSTADAANPVALVVAFHGLNSNCDRFLGNTNFEKYAEEEGFVVVSACGSLGFLGTGWNAGMCCGFADSKPDDVDLARRIVAQIGEDLCIDPARVMALGFSNGAMLAEVLACEAPDVFKAVVSMSGIEEMRPGGSRGLEACDAKVAPTLYRSHVLMIHGDLDIMVPWSGSPLLGFPSIPENVEGWVRRNGCSSSPTATINTSKAVNEIYLDCIANNSAPPPSSQLDQPTYSLLWLLKLGLRQFLPKIWSALAARLPFRSDAASAAVMEAALVPETVASVTEVEIVRVIGGAHILFADDRFPVMEYAYHFGRRVFGSYH